MGASGNLFDAFPPKPPRMHWTTYERAEMARERSLVFLADCGSTALGRHGGSGPRWAGG